MWDMGRYHAAKQSCDRRRTQRVAEWFRWPQLPTMDCIMVLRDAHKCMLVNNVHICIDPYKRRMIVGIDTCLQRLHKQEKERQMKELRVLNFSCMTLQTKYACEWEQLMPDHPQLHFIYWSTGSPQIRDTVAHKLITRAPQHSMTFSHNFNHWVATTAPNQHLLRPPQIATRDHMLQSMMRENQQIAGTHLCLW